MTPGGREQLAVPRAEFRSYYGRAVLKPPVWEWKVAAYLFAGGLSAGSALLGAGADLSDRPALRRVGRVGRRWPASWRACTSWSPTWDGRSGSTTCCGWPSRVRR